jgi:hypothetical protein
VQGARGVARGKLDSLESHATMTSLRRFVTVALDDGRTMVPIAPLRNPPIADVMLHPVA